MCHRRFYPGVTQWRTSTYHTHIPPSTGLDETNHCNSTHGPHNRCCDLTSLSRLFSATTLSSPAPPQPCQTYFPNHRFTHYQPRKGLKNRSTTLKSTSKERTNEKPSLPRLMPLYAVKFLFAPSLPTHPISPYRSTNAASGTNRGTMSIRRYHRLCARTIDLTHARLKRLLGYAPSQPTQAY